MKYINYLILFLFVFAVSCTSQNELPEPCEMVEIEAKTELDYIQAQQAHLKQGKSIPVAQLIDYPTEKTSDWDIFRLRMYSMAKELKFDHGLKASHEQIYNWTMKTIFIESGYKPDAKNPKSTAQGLIQCLKSTRESLGVHGELTDYSAIQQVGIIHHYFNRKISTVGAENINSFIDFYMLVFYPRASSKPLNYTLFRQGSKAYKANKGYDLNKDGEVKKAEIASFINRKIERLSKSKT